MKLNLNIGTLLIIAAVGFLGYKLLSRPKTQPPLPPPPPGPVRNNPEWVNWVNTVIGLAGNVASLWAPGGPFYNYRKDLEDVLDYVPPPNPPDTGWV